MNCGGFGSICPGLGLLFYAALLGAVGGWVVVDRGEDDVLRKMLLVALFSYTTFCVNRVGFMGRLSFDPVVINVVLNVLCTGDLQGGLPRA